MHVLRGCPAANDVWAVDCSPIQKWSTREVDFLQLWAKLITSLQQDELEWVAVTMRMLWIRRNLFIF